MFLLTYFCLNQSFPHLNLNFLSPSAIGVTTAGVKAVCIWLHTTDTSPAEIKESTHHITIIVSVEMYRPKWNFTLGVSAELSLNRGEIPQAYGKSSGWHSRSPAALHQALGAHH